MQLCYWRACYISQWSCSSWSMHLGRGAFVSLCCPNRSTQTCANYFVDSGRRTKAVKAVVPLASILPPSWPWAMPGSSPCSSASLHRSSHPPPAPYADLPLQPCWMTCCIFFDSCKGSWAAKMLVLDWDVCVSNFIQNPQTIDQHHHKLSQLGYVPIIPATAYMLLNWSWHDWYL